MPTQLIRSIHAILPYQQGGVVTLGNFDGVHLGHQALIQRVVAEARSQALPSTVVTFEPHPFEFFNQSSLTIPRLTRMREKFCALRDLGADNVCILKFNQSLADLSASEFVTTVLHRGLKAKHVIVGDDFRFGKKRQGDFLLLKQLGNELGYTVESMETVQIEGERVSSTRVRQALMDGDQAQVRRLLGRSYSLMGRVRQGDQRGRQLGFPTANIFLHRKLAPLRGVYTVYMHGISDQPLPGVANLGVRPTVDGTRMLLEVHLLDFNQDIYGRHVCVEFCEKLRDEMRFDGLDKLIEQIKTDVEQSKNYFKKG